MSHHKRDDLFLTSAEKSDRDSKRLQLLKVLDAELGSIQKGASVYETSSGSGTVFFRSSDPNRLRSNTKREIAQLEKSNKPSSKDLKF
jgi:hypothetical protein